MKLSIATYILAISCAAATSANATQTVVDFEDLPLWSTPVDGYGGASGWGTSGGVYASNGEGQGLNMFVGAFVGEISFTKAPIIFEGLLFKPYKSIPNFTAIGLYYQGQRVHVILDPQAPLGLAWFDSGYSGLVDHIVFAGGSQGYAIDNLTYSIPAVPEPEGLAMLLSGLGVITLVARRRRNKMSTLRRANPVA